jgi:hypothetical protein
VESLFKCLVVADVLWALFVEFEIRENARLIKGNGSQNSLHQLFHRQRTTIRGIVAVLLALIPTACFWGSPWSMGLAFVAQVIYLAAYFARTFNPRLNVARKELHIDRFYTSFDEDAAKWPDQRVARQALAEANELYAARGGSPSSLLGQATAQNLARQLAPGILKALLNRVLFGGIALSAILYGVAAAIQ